VSGRLAGVAGTGIAAFFGRNGKPCRLLLCEGGAEMTIAYHEDDDTRVAEIRVGGKITTEEYDRAVMPLQEFIDRHGTVKLLEIVDSFGGYDPSLIWEGLKFDFRNVRHISHVAVVSDIGWIGPVSKAAGALLPTRLRTFGMDELGTARDWITRA